MKFRFTAFFVGTAAFLTFCAQQARADWLVKQVSPKDSAESVCVFKVKIKDVKSVKEGEITVTLGKRKREHLREKSNGFLYLNSSGAVLTEYPSERGEAVVVKERWNKDTVTYKFRVPADQLPKLRFEFWESGELGGDIYWFSVQEFVAAKK